jgi:hypothetical protein
MVEGDETRRSGSFLTKVAHSTLENNEYNMRGLKEKPHVKIIRGVISQEHEPECRVRLS